MKQREALDVRWVWILVGWYAAMSVATLGAYWLDKRAAAMGSWRTRERTLHSLSWLGGWPGALAAMKLLRHKNRKVAFLVWVWLAATAHLVLWVWLWMR